MSTVCWRVLSAFVNHLIPELVFNSTQIFAVHLSLVFNYITHCIVLYSYMWCTIVVCELVSVVLILELKILYTYQSRLMQWCYWITYGKIVFNNGFDCTWCTELIFRLQFVFVFGFWKMQKMILIFLSGNIGIDFNVSVPLVLSRIRRLYNNPSTTEF